MTSRKKTPSVERKPAKSAVVPRTRRTIGAPREIELYVAAGGRCEFDSCNRDLMRHHVTQSPGKFGEKAHIVAFRPDGPRGNTRRRPSDINSLDNLMLLCGECHDLVDKKEPEKYPVRVLREYKRKREAHVAALMDLLPENFTTAVTFMAPIGEHLPAIDRAAIVQAVAPAFPRKDVVEIDLTGLGPGGGGYVAAAKNSIRHKVNLLLDPAAPNGLPSRLSLFAMGPIPLLAFVGRSLGDKIPLELFQRHTDTEDWVWKQGGRPVRYSFMSLRSGSNDKRVALLLSLSGRVIRAKLPRVIAGDVPIYEITLQGQTPTRTFLRRHDDLQRFKNIYHKALAEIAERHPEIEELHLFGAVPAPIAVLCGREPLARASADILIYDYDRNRGYHSPIRITTHETK